MGIANDTPIIPEVMARTVKEELSTFLRLETDELQGSESALVERAEGCYRLNEHVRRCIRRKGNKGRDYLFAFMRHWLAGWVLDNRPLLFPKIPSEYCNGDNLPAH